MLHTDGLNKHQKSFFRINVISINVRILGNGRTGFLPIASIISDSDLTYHFLLGNISDLLIRATYTPKINHIITRCDFVAYGQGMQKTLQFFFM
jgi:hypothetical protein